MKKYLITSLLLITLIPSIAFASWWNPLSWFNNWKFNKIEKIQEKLQQEEKINEFQKQIEELKNNKENPEQKPKEENKTEVKKEIEKTNKTTEQKDVCSNIEGIQIITPEGYSNNLGTCTQMKDLCPNIDGIQTAVPSGKYIYRNTNECLTNDEIDKYINKKEEERKERENILKKLAEINNLNNYYSDLSTDKLKEILREEEDRERNKILSGINDDLAEEYYYSDLSNSELKEAIKIEQEKNNCLLKKSPYYTYKWNEDKNTCKNILKDGYYIGCCGQVIKGTEPSNLNCHHFACP